jgi:hypothetical protein
MPTAKRRPSGHSVVARAITPDDLKVRLQERDRRLAADNRSEAQRWLGDPPFTQSALAQRRDKPPVRFRG